MDREAPRELATSGRRWLTRAELPVAPSEPIAMDAGFPSAATPSQPGSPMPASAFASSGVTRWDRADDGGASKPAAPKTADPRRSRWGPPNAPEASFLTSLSSSPDPCRILRESGGGQSDALGLAASRLSLGPPPG